jgi:hypothetical protein
MGERPWNLSARRIGLACKIANPASPNAPECFREYLEARFPLCDWPATLPKFKIRLTNMEPEDLDIQSITDARRKAIEKTIQPIDIEQLKALGEKVFPTFDHPWRETFFQFLEENSGSTFYHATTHDQVEIIFCPDKEKGMWFLRRGGTGPLQAKGLQTLKEILAKA